VGTAEDRARELTELARACVHCGLCVPHCPTYRVTREETDSPRGRVFLLEAFEQGRATADEVRGPIDRCIGCRHCESVCPSGVSYGALLEHGRARLGGPGALARIFLRHVVPRPRLVGALAFAGRMLGRVPPRPRPLRWPDPPARPKARIAVHVGCVTPHLFPRLAAEVAHVLARLGYRADPARGCCGALHRHAGLEPPPAPALPEFDAVVSAAAGCSATDGLTDVCRLLLDERPFPGARLAPVRVAYDAPCHLLAQGVDAAALLDAIEGVERVPLDEAEQCCGAGGLYMELQGELARAVRERKLDAIAASGAGVVATPNPGCMTWLWRGLRARRLAVDVVHPVSLLARALGV